MTSSERERTPGAKALLGLALLVCFFNFTRSIDFKDYLLRSGQAFESGFRVPPYPVERALFGDFFQSPIVVVLLSPLSRLPLFAAKLLWAIASTAGVVWLWRKWRGPVDFTHALFLVFLFAHPLSDVYLSANINFTLLCLLVGGWTAFQSESRGALAVGALCFSLAILIKVQPVLFVAWFAFRGEWRKVLAVLGGVAFWIAFTSLVMPIDSFASWWVGWWRALGLYHQSAFAGTLSYQSPPAALFRWLAAHTALDYERRLFATALFSGAIQLCLLAAAIRRDERTAFALLASSFFLGGPYSWALTVLFLFPLVRLAYRQRKPGAVEWAAAGLLAALPKAAWPEAVWNRIAGNSVPAVCLMVVAAAAVWRLLSDAGIESWRSSALRRAQPA